MKDLDAHSELQELSPLLAGLEKQNPFQIPDSYFTFFSDELKKHRLENSLDGELDSDSFLRRYKAESSASLKIPEGYFDELPGFILLKAKRNSESPRLKGIQIAFRHYRGVAVAASVAALLFLGMTLMHPAYKMETAATTLKQEDIKQYIRQNITDFDEQIIASVGETNALQPVLIENAEDSSSYNNSLRDASGIDINEISNLQNN